MPGPIGPTSTFRPTHVSLACMSQFLLGRLGRCLRLFVSTESTSSHEFASQFGLAFFYTRKTPKTDLEDRPSHKCILNEPASDPAKKGGNVSHGRSIAID